MVKIIGPLHSDSASGTIGPRITFSMRKTGPQARFQKAQKDVLTSGREVQRGYFKTACDWWNTLTAVEQLEWENLSHQI